MAETKRQRVILPHTSVADKYPEITNVLPGEVYVNGASGDGKSFLTLKKSNDELATFHEDAHWDKLIGALSGHVETIEETIGDISDILDDVLYNL